MPDDNFKEKTLDQLREEASWYSKYKLKHKTKLRILNFVLCYYSYFEYQDASSRSWSNVFSLKLSAGIGFCHAILHLAQVDSFENLSRVFCAFYTRRLGTKVYMFDGKRVEVWRSTEGKTSNFNKTSFFMAKFHARRVSFVQYPYKIELNVFVLKALVRLGLDE